LQGYLFELWCLTCALQGSLQDCLQWWWSNSGTGAEIKQCANYADEHYGNRLGKYCGDSLRHLVFMCMANIYYDDDCARELGKANENLENNTCEESARDLHNNEEGLNLNGTSCDDCIQKALNAQVNSFPTKGNIMFSNEGCGHGCN